MTMPKIALKRRGFLRGSVAGAASAMLPALARAQSDAARITIIVPTPIGGTPDLVARIAAEHIRSLTGRTVLVENRPGASTMLGMQVALAATSGTTLVLAPEVLLTLWPYTQRKLPYDPDKDFVQIGPLAGGPHGLVTSTLTPARTLAEFVAWSKANPAKSSYGTPGEGTPQHLLGVTFARAAGIELLHVPYKGGALALQDLIGGQIASMITAIPLVVGPHRNGTLRILAVTGLERSAVLPGVPTFKELGYEGFVDEGVMGLIAPAKTPAQEVRLLREILQKFSRTSEFADSVVKVGMRPYLRNLDDYAREMRQASDYWRRAVQAAGFQPQ